EDVSNRAENGLAASVAIVVHASAPAAEYSKRTELIFRPWIADTVARSVTVPLSTGPGFASLPVGASVMNSSLVGQALRVISSASFPEGGLSRLSGTVATMWFFLSARTPSMTGRLTLKVRLRVNRSNPVN